MGPAALGVECGSAHIDGAKSIRVDGRHRSELPARAETGDDDRPQYGSMC